MRNTHPQQKEESAHRTPRPASAFDKFSKHSRESEWYKNMALPIDRLNNTFKDINVKKLIEESRGEDFYGQITKKLQSYGLSPSTADLNSFERFGQVVLGNWVAAKIGLTPSVPLKQLTSAINYSENMPVGEWVKGFAKNLATPIETFNWVWDNVPYVRTRFKGGYSEAMQYAMSASKNLPKISNRMQAIRAIETMGTRGGDIMAIIYGGKPYIDYLQKIGLSKEEAIEKFVLDTTRSQQSPFSSALSSFQNSKNPLAKMIFTFANTPSQYSRKMYEAILAYRFGDISAAQATKTIAMYAVVNQFTYIFVGALVSSLMKGSDWEDDLLEESLVQIGTSVVAGIPLGRDAVNTMLREFAGLHVYDKELPVMGDIYSIIQSSAKLIKKNGELTSEETQKEIKKIIIKSAEIGFGVSAANIEKDIKATILRRKTLKATKIKKIDQTLTDLGKDKRSMDAELSQGNQSKFYLEQMKRLPKYQDAKQSSDLKSAYSSAKNKAKELRGKHKTVKADLLLKFIDDSKIRLSKTEMRPIDMKIEIKVFKGMTKNLK